MAYPKQRSAAPGRNNLHGAYEPPNGLGRPAPSVNCRTSIVAVRDPAPDAGFARTQATVRVDLLELELAHGRIEEAEYLAGRQVERLFDAQRSIKASSLWRTSGRVDNASETNPGLRLLERLSHVEETKREAVRCIGEAGLKFMERLLADGLSFAGFAEITGRGGERGTAAVADRFRWLLKELADGWAARGKERA